MLYFNAQPSGNSALLDWATATEINNVGFQVQRYNEKSNDWDYIGIVPSKANAGISFNKLTYDFTDADVYHPDMGVKTFYYRLKQTDYNNDFKYSEVRSVTFKSDKIPDQIIVNIFPNPVSDDLYLEVISNKTSGPYEVTFFDKYGKIALSAIVKNRGFIDVRSLPQGSYNMTIKNEKTFIKNQSIIVAR
jgi:hypothetical protein